MTRVDGRAVLITGAASGLGRLMAQRFAGLGAELALWDVDPVGLETTAALVSRESGRDPATVTVDLTSTDEIDAAVARTRSAVGEPHVLVNNAGIITGQWLSELSDDQVERVVQVNTVAPILITKRFLPAMLARDAGHIVTIASAAALSGVPRLTTYCATKHAVFGFDDALRHELRAGSSNVVTTVVCPFWVNTGFSAGVKTRFPWLLPILEPDVVAERIVRGVLRNRRRLSMPWMVKTVPALRALPPRLTDPIADFLGVNTMMEGFTGRADAPGRVA